MMAIAVVLVSSGAFFLLMGAIGLLRFPDFYTRMHAAGKCDTLGSLLVLTGLACSEGAGADEREDPGDGALHLCDQPHGRSRGRQGGAQERAGLLDE